MASLTLTNEFTSNSNEVITIVSSRLKRNVRRLRTLGANLGSGVKSYFAAMAASREVHSNASDKWETVARDRAEMAMGVYRSIR